MNKLAEKGKRIYQQFINNLGRKNYEKKLKEKPEEYSIGYNSPKKDRQAIYYIKKNIYPSQDGRYQSRFGNLKYLKDYIFGFSYLYKPLIRRIDYDA